MSNLSQEYKLVARLSVPTYVGDDPKAKKDFDDNRRAELCAYSEDGLRICLGGLFEERVPDLVIEKGQDCWRIFVHSDSGCDEACKIEIHQKRTLVFDARGRTRFEVARG